MKRNNLYLILAVLLVVALTVFLGYSLREYYKADADPMQNTHEDYLVTLKETGMDTLNCVTIENPNTSYKIFNNGDALVIEGLEQLPTDKDTMLSLAKSLTTVRGAPVPSSEKAFEQYGIDGKTTVTAHYTDNTTITFRFGQPFENKTPCYIDETSQLYFFPSDFLVERNYKPNNFINKHITNVPSNSEIKSLSLLGECRPVPITIKELLSAGKEKRYVVTEPEKAILSKMDLESTLGKVFEIHALDAAVLDPQPEDIKSYGLDEPFSIMSISTTHDSFVLKTTEPTQDNTAFLMRDDTAVIYKVDTTELTWITAQQQDLVPTFYIPPPMNEISGLKITTEDKAYIFNLQHQDEGVRITLSGKYIVPCIFEKFVENITRISAKDFVTTTTDVPPTLKIELSHKEPGKGSDIIAFIPSEENESDIYISINGEVRYTTSPGAIDKILTNCQNMVEGKCLV